MHEKRFHIIAVSRELDFFGHEHSNEAEGKPLEVPFTFPRAGRYRIFVEFQPAGEKPQRLVEDRSFAAARPPAAALARSR